MWSKKKKKKGAKRKLKIYILYLQEKLTLEYTKKKKRCFKINCTAVEK